MTSPRFTSKVHLHFGPRCWAANFKTNTRSRSNQLPLVPLHRPFSLPTTAVPSSTPSVCSCEHSPSPLPVIPCEGGPLHHSHPNPLRFFTVSCRFYPCHPTLSSRLRYCIPKCGHSLTSNNGAAESGGRGNPSPAEAGISAGYWRQSRIVPPTASSRFCQPGACYAWHQPSDLSISIQ